jgi:hypothetical protein
MIIDLRRSEHVELHCRVALRGKGRGTQLISLEIEVEDVAPHEDHLQEEIDKLLSNGPVNAVTTLRRVHYSEFINLFLH